MKIEDLMKPRYKVIATWPDMENYQVGIGDVIGLTHHLGDEETVKMFYDKYPHLFKKLEWWEEREEKDLPEYVEVQANIVDAYGRFLKIDSWRTDVVPIAVFKGHTIAAWYLKPATKEQCCFKVLDNE